MKQELTRYIQFAIDNGYIEKCYFYLDDEKQASPAYHLPLNYIYESNAAILKSGVPVIVIPPASDVL